MAERQEESQPRINQIKYGTVFYGIFCAIENSTALFFRINNLSTKVSGALL